MILVLGIVAPASLMAIDGRTMETAMTATFETGLFGTTTTGTFVKCLAITFPPASSGTSHTLSISLPTGVTVQSVTIPGGMNWASNTLTIPSTFTTPNSRIVVNLSNNANAIFSVILSGSSQNGAASSLQVNDNGFMSVASTGQGVTFKGCTPSIQSIPEGGWVTVQHAEFLIPNGTGSQDFAFSAPGFVFSASDPNAVSITESGSLATIQGLAPDAFVTLTVSNLNEQIGSFIVRRMDSGTTTPSGSTSEVIPTDGVLIVKSLGSGTLLRGNNFKYETNGAGAFDLAFSVATSNFSFVSPFASFSNTFGADFSVDIKTASFILIKNLGAPLASTSLTLFTDAGTWDPTIINDPDHGPISYESESEKANT